MAYEVIFRGLKKSNPPLTQSIHCSIGKSLSLTSSHDTRTSGFRGALTGYRLRYHRLLVG